uniref:TNFR-Cys domain-containing protein n=1 Tax=Cynoglossus semilaevis TaxID=244447 RepID=A0A3P8UR08_CYNSE
CNVIYTVQYTIYQYKVCVVLIQLKTLFPLKRVWSCSTSTVSPFTFDLCHLCILTDLGLKTLTPCTVVQDTTCEPLDGFFCINRTENHCTAAQNHTRCQPGQYIRNNGTAATDTECSDCTSGTFSDGTFTVCRPHTQ